MKKISCFILLFFIFTLNVSAFESSFDIDMNNINISSKSDVLIDELDKQYKIETDDFSTNISDVGKVKEFVKKLVDISFKNTNAQAKNKELTEYIYINKDNGTETLTASLMISTYVDELTKYKISYDYIKVIRVVSSDRGIFAFAYISDANVSGKKQDIVLTFWLKLVDGEYKLYFPWINFGDNLNEYFNNIASNEREGKVLGGTYKNISIDGKVVTPTEEELSLLFNTNIASNVQITALKENGISNYASGFYIRKGVIITTWSTFLNYLSDSNFVYVNDYEKTYNIEGVIAANEKYDVVVLKLDSEVGRPVTFGDSSKLKTDDKLFTINSKNNIGFSINYGSFISMDNGRLSNFFALSSSDVGSALYNKDGNVVGFNTDDVLSSELSYAHSTDYLVKLQEILSNEEYDNIKVSSLDNFKDHYYNKLTKEKEYNYVDEDTWDKLSKVGNLNDKIPLPLIKASYEDKILSVRYKNEAISSLDTMYLVSDYISSLEDSGYKMTLNNYNKKILQNRKYKIIIKEDLNYLIILIMEN